MLNPVQHDVNVRHSGLDPESAQSELQFMTSRLHNAYGIPTTRVLHTPSLHFGTRTDGSICTSNFVLLISNL